jgi:TRAP-type C4-dicarboxylate transport system permease small subunit
VDRSGAGTGALTTSPARRDPLAVACSLLLAGIAALCLVEVTLRYGFGGGLGFYDELAGFALVWLTFLGAVLARRDGAHIGIRDLVSRLSPRPRRIARILEHTAVLVLHLVLAWFGTVLVLRFLGERSITMPIPMGAFYLVLPLFAVLTGVMEARRLVALLRSPGD